MPMTELERMKAGEWYCCLDPELEGLRMIARRAVHEHNSLDPDIRGPIAHNLAALFGSIGKDVFIEAPFHCAYGFNISFGDGAYLNAGCTILDSSLVEIGERALLGPNVQIYCAEHHSDAARRSSGEEIARPVSVGCDVWIGGAAILLPGVKIGDRATVGAGSVVTRNVPADTVVAGNPARPLL